VVKHDGTGAKTETIWFTNEVEGHYDGSGNWMHSYAHVNMGTPVARVDTGSSLIGKVEYQFHGLANNTLAAVDQSTGTVNTCLDVAPYGEVIEATDAGSGSGAGFSVHRRRLNDKFVDAISDLGYYGARYYDKVSMNWTQGDPLYRFGPDIAGASPRRADLYQFSLNNPLRYMDPDGLDAGWWTTNNQKFLDYALSKGTDPRLSAPTIYEESGHTATMETQYCGTSAPGLCDPFGYNSTTTARHEVVPVVTWTFSPDEWWEHMDDLPAGRRPPIFKSDDTAAERRVKEGKAIGSGIASGIALGLIVGWLGVGAIIEGGAVTAGSTTISADALANTVNHVFGKAVHKLAPLIVRFGSTTAAFKAIESATVSAVRSQNLTGIFETIVKVGGSDVTVRGAVVDNVVRVSTAFIP